MKSHTQKVPSIFLAAAESMCPSCGTAVSLLTFRDDESKQEFLDSGICQECQDEIFYSPYPR